MDKCSTVTSRTILGIMEKMETSLTFLLSNKLPFFEEMACD